MYLSTSMGVPSVKLYLFLGEFKIISLSREPEGIHSLLTCSPDIGVWARDSVGKRDEYCSISAIHLFQLGILIYVSYMLRLSKKVSFKLFLSRYFDRINHPKLRLTNYNL
jgi:hypothetical protein